mmetsp:Transcript_15190/g.22603  ORF Transcript_15190/g.22603 Transcript_15190/m.22603 type:complete len:203 (-) Transcript_15190:394-1002(-)
MSNCKHVPWYHRSHWSQPSMKLPSEGPPQTQCLAPLSSIVCESCASSAMIIGISLAPALSSFNKPTSNGFFSPGNGARAFFTFACHKLARFSIERSIRTLFSSGSLKPLFSLWDTRDFISSFLGFRARIVKARRHHEKQLKALITIETSFNSEMPMEKASFTMRFIGSEMFPSKGGRLMLASSLVEGAIIDDRTMMHHRFRK